MKNMKIKLARVEKDLSQEELAKIVGVSRQTIGLIESGKYNPSISLCPQHLDILINICRHHDNPKVPPKYKSYRKTHRLEKSRRQKKRIAHIYISNICDSFIFL